jgi:acetoin utilization deacetylase AcuC-like enzyme
MTGIIYDEIFLKHRPPGAFAFGEHPESPERLLAIVEHLRKCSLWEELKTLNFRPANVEEVARIHTSDYIDKVRSLAESGGGYLDLDTFVGSESFDAALASAGAAISASDAVMKGEVKNAFSLGRPPGHHALPSCGMGFCLFNNVAIAAAHLKAAYSIERIAIIDWDVHHGNGTQEAFYEDPGVLYISFHLFPFYPGTGKPEEIGRGRGAGFTVNVPFGWRTARQEYLSKFQQTLQEKVPPFKPEFILISAGFDAHRADPLAALLLEVEDFGRMSEVVLEMAARFASGRLVSVLEGGYHLQFLPLSVEAHLRALSSA